MPEDFDVVEPPALREPVSLWLRGLEERARRERWTGLLGRSVVVAWNAARAILATREALGGEQGRPPGAGPSGGDG
ncbi:hypothetical protein [Saccharothrix xinjiangensis]|uniref:Uncharacterized protein n=1 Tax=Saccharothrix xinjiangensis TaxID=204798 RepID=A0ABV9XVZ7_9PSEU